MSEFSFSRFSNCIEDYRCFFNPGTGYITGQELKEIKQKGDEEAKKKWLYFFPVDIEEVGKSQKQEIASREREICTTKYSIDKERQNFSNKAVFFGILSFVAIVILFPLILVTLGILAFHYVKYRSAKSTLENRIAQKNREISILKDEIEFLLKQVETFRDKEKIENLLKNEVKKLELKAISEITSENIDSETQLNNYIKSQQTDKYFGVRSLLIDGWGIMQPFKIRGVGGDLESTGLQRIIEELGERSLAVGLDTKYNPIFRLYYFQFIFLLEKNINVASFFYDFIQRRKFGSKLETFQYPHITNFSIRDTEMEEFQIKGLGQLMRSIVDDNPQVTDIFLKYTLQAFTLTVASGAHFKCVLVDEVVRNGLNKWFEAIDAKREVVESDTDEKRKSELIKKIKRYEEIKDYENVSKAREVIKEVKNGVERFAK